jgi:hypothetical protein
MRGNRNVDGCLSGGGECETKISKERYDLIFMSISPAPNNQKFFTFSHHGCFSFGFHAFFKKCLSSHIFSASFL